MMPTAEQWKEYMELKERERIDAQKKHEETIKLMQEQLEAEREAKKFEQEAEKQARLIEFEEREQFYKTQTDALMAKLSDIMIVATNNEESDNSERLPASVKFTRVLDYFMKSNKIKPYNPKSLNVDTWFLSVIDEINNICVAKHLDVNTLTEQQKVKLIKLKLPYDVKAQISKFCVRENTTIDDVSVKKLKELMKKHCGITVPPEIEIMKLLGVERYVKPADVLMVEHVLGFQDRLPASVQPSDDIEELKKMRDLIQRTCFYASIDNAEVRKALIEIPEEKASYSEFTKVAIQRSEQLKNNESSQKVVEKIEKLKDEAAAPVLKADNSQYRDNQKASRGRGNFRGRGSFRGYGGGRGNFSGRRDTIKCYDCGKFGHIAKFCTEKKPESSASGSGSVATRSVDVDLESYFSSSLPKVLCVNASSNVDDKYCERINMSLILNADLQVLFEFDTAAGISIIPKAYLELFSQEKRPVLKPCDIKLDLANGQSAEVVGSVKVDVVSSNCKNMKPVNAWFLVVDGPHALLGRPLMKLLFPTLYSSIMELSGKLLKCHGDRNYKQVPGRCLVARNVPVLKPSLRNKEASVSGHNTKSDDVCSNGASGITEKVKLSPEKTPPLCSKLPAPPTGTVSQEDGAKYCRMIYEAHPALYDGKQGLIKGVKAKITLKPGAEKHLKVMKPARVSYAAKEGYDRQVDKLLQTGKLVDGVGLKVASQIVPVITMKSGEVDVRNTVNYKPTVNPWIVDEYYNFPKPDDIVNDLQGEHYTVIDVKDAYPHMELEEESQEILTIATDRGYVQPTRLPQGVKTAPKIFQSYMDKLLTGPKMVKCVVDDIVITGKDPAEHFQNVETVCHRLEESGMKVNPNKCQFYLPEVKYLGRIINKDGHRMDPGAMDAIVNMPAPKSRQELQSFLGYLSYVRRYVPDVSRVTPILSELLKKEVKFVWLDKHEEAFNKCKKLASNMATLIYYDPDKELVLTTDASPVGLGACLSHRVQEGKKTRLRAIAYASRSLTNAEKNYAQYEREGLAVVWAIKYFRQFLYGRHFYLQTDCSALKSIFGPNYDMGCGAMTRIKRWCVELMEYDFTAQHIRGVKNLVCDSLSRLPQPEPESLSMEDSGSKVEGKSTSEIIGMSESAAAHCLSMLPIHGVESESLESEEVAHFAKDRRFPLTAADVARATREDPLYGRVLNAVKSGEFDKNDRAMLPFYTIRDSLSVEGGCILFGSRIVIPTCQQPRLLFDMHMTHFGVVKMKSLAREYMWWPGINKQIEELARGCKSCAKYKKKAPRTPLTHWPWATRPMERIHIDFADYKGVQLLIVIDAYSKFLWTSVMGNDTTTSKLLRHLDAIFADRGLPTIIVSDNGPQMTSQQFKDHMKSKNIKHVLSPPYHPASNGLAEVAVGVVKNALRKMEAPVSPVLLQDTVNTMLFYYRMTPSTATGRTPFELMNENKIRTPLSSLRPSLEIKNENVQQQRVSRDSVTSRSLRQFEINDNVLVYNKLSKVNDTGYIVKGNGKNCYEVNVGGRVKLVSADDLQMNESMDNNVKSDEKDNVENDKISMFSFSGTDTDNESEMSDSDRISNDFVKKRKYVVPQRRKETKKYNRRKEVDMLKDALSNNETVASKTRSGRSGK